MLSFPSLTPKRAPGDPPLTSRARKFSGFTLIELLVVIAIIAILASILFPVFSRAREMARRASCQSNLKQISLGLQQYTQDYDEKYVKQIIIAAPTYYSYAEALQPYIKSEQAYMCPSATGIPQDPTANNIATADHRWRITFQSGVQFTGSYGMNYSLDSKSVSMISQSALVPAFVDSGNFSNAGISDPSIFARHFEGINVAYCDGHVKYFNMKRALGDLDFTLYTTG